LQLSDQIDQVEVTWSTGETSTITGGLKAGQRYVIQRQ
jgi:hypothetical protein